VSDGPHELHITLFDADTGGGQVGDPLVITATVQDGVISEQLPVGDISVFDEGQRLWAEVSMDADPPLSPRIPLIAVPYSFRAHRVGSVELDDDLVLGSGADSGSLRLYDDQGVVVVTLRGTGDPAVDVTGTVRMGGIILDEPTEPGFVLTSDSFGRGTWQSLPPTSGYWTASGDDIYNNNAGDVGIGTTTPQYPLHVSAGVGQALYSASTDGTGVYGLHDASTGIDPGVQGATNSTSENAAGVIGEVSPAYPGAYSAGVRGINNGTGSFGIGVWGSHGGYGWGVYGTAVGGSGVRGRATAAGGANYGVYGQSDSAQGRGVYGLATAASGSTYGVIAESRSDAGHAIHGLASALTGDARGVHGESLSEAGRGVHGVASASTGDTFGVYGESRSDTGVGVFGAATSTSGFVSGGRFECASPGGRAVMGLNDATTGNYAYGVYGNTRSETGAGVRGGAAALSGENYGVSGESSSTEGRGVFGTANQTSGTCYGVYGRSFSTSGRGVYGEATHYNGFTYGGEFVAQSWEGTGVLGKTTDVTTDLTRGVHGVNLSPTAVGVLGQCGTVSWYLQGSGVAGCSDTIGVYGRALATSGANYGVRGQTDSATGYGLYSEGDCHIAGTLSKSGGSFKIDHPLDPENKYLAHSFVESPDMMNVYNGNVTTDADGNATITLPAYFEALNRDFRYQLTVIGQFAQAIVAEEIRDNRFVIRTDKPSVKVSWQVTGIRHDPWAEQHRIRVEEEKPADHQGRYLNPESFGEPKELGIHYVPERHHVAAGGLADDKRQGQESDHE
jgi:hypothetical protein